MNNHITILYVEDEKDIRMNVQRPLKRLSNEVIMASNGEEGLEYYKKYKPDIVISDINMPLMNGIDMAKAIKEINGNQHIIFTTAHSESHYFIDAIEMQVDGYIMKPIDYELLEHKIIHITKQIISNRKFKEQNILINEIARLQDILLFVVDKNKKNIFLNEKFLAFFNVSDIAGFNQRCKTISDLFIKHSGCFYPKPDRDWIDDIKRTIDEKRRVIALKDSKEELHTFVVSFKEIQESEHLIFIFTEITNLSMERKQLRKEVYLDKLTQVPNRAYFEKYFSIEMERYKREASSISLILLDIDKFKIFNDTYGHQVGDEVLIELASLIKKNKRETDIFTRWGGEEFVKLLPNTSLSNAVKVANKLRERIENHIFPNNLRVTCSFGIAEFNFGDEQSSILKRADDALYKAKQNGRNRVEF